MTEIVTENHKRLWKDDEGVNWTNMRTILNIPSGVWGRGGFGQSGLKEAILFLKTFGYVDDRPASQILLRKTPFPKQMSEADYQELANIVHKLDPKGRKDQSIVFDNLIAGFHALLALLHI